MDERCRLARISPALRALGITLVALGCSPEAARRGSGEAAADVADVADAATPMSARSGEDSSADWGSAPPALRYAYIRARQLTGADDARFHVHAEGQRLVAVSPTRRVRAEFAAEGVAITGVGGASVVLRSQRAHCDSFSVETTRSPFERDDAPHRASRTLSEGALTISEWVESGPLGLEHGFDVDHAGPCASLTIDVGLEGASALLADDAITLLTPGGALRYDELLAVDREGRALDARFVLDGDVVSLRVDTRGASFPVTIDPLVYVEEQRLGPIGVAIGDTAAFGSAVAIEGDTALIGAPLEDVGASDHQGAAYVFVRAAGAWSLEQKLVAADGARDDYFGQGVALSGDTALVGAYLDDDDGDNSGSAYVFVRAAGAWTEQAKLTASDASRVDQFGNRVDLEGDTALISAHRDGVDVGAAYVFVRAGTSWSEQAKLTASDGAADDLFGSYVALSGETALIGAAGDQEAGAYTGAAYVFIRAGTSWTEQAKLTASDATAGTHFGRAVALSGDTALIGAHWDDAGSAYVFVRAGGTWSEQAKLTASDGMTDDHFGINVALEGDTALVGAYRDDTGSAYVFTRTAGVWTEQFPLVASDGNSGDQFGVAVALSGGTTLIGANRRSSDRGLAYVGGSRHEGGDACTTNDECDSGFCVDGVCCDTACGGGVSDDCQACSVASGASVDGVCGPSDGNACTDGLACTNADVCTAGTCGGTSSCDAETSCTEGEAESFTCGACPAGTASADGSGASACVTCADGTWSAAGATTCTTWSECGDDEFELDAPSETTDRVCSSLTVCGDEQFEASAPTATTDRVCTDCTVCSPEAMVFRECSATEDTLCSPGDPPPSDAGVDAGMDAGVDAGVDAGMDAGVDPGMDAGITTDAGPVISGPTGGGCSCRTTSGQPPSLAFFLLGWVLWRRSRKRR